MENWQIEKASFTHSITFLTHEKAPKLIYSNVFKIFSGGNTPNTPLRERATPTCTHPQHGLRPCAVAIIPTPQIVSPPPIIQTDWRLCRAEKLLQACRPWVSQPCSSVSYYVLLKSQLDRNGVGVRYIYIYIYICRTYSTSPYDSTMLRQHLETGYIGQVQVKVQFYSLYQ